MEFEIAENEISQHLQSAEEKSKQRAAELRKRVDCALTDEANHHPLLERRRVALENEIVEEFNRFLAIVHTSSTYILIEKGETEFVLDSKSSLLMLYENQPVWELATKNAKKPPTKAQIWLQSPNRRTFDNIVFNPREEGHYKKNYNIWKGFAVKPEQGDCSLYWDHLRVVICNGKDSHYI